MVSDNDFIENMNKVTFEDIIKSLTPIIRTECNDEQSNTYKFVIIDLYIGYMNEHKRWLYKGNIYYHEFYRIKYQNSEELPKKLLELYNWLIKDKLL